MKFLTVLISSFNYPCTVHVLEGTSLTLTIIFQQHAMSESNEALQREIQNLEQTVKEREEVKMLVYNICSNFQFLCLHDGK